MNECLTSTDGTDIAYESMGDGPPVVLVGGGLDDGPRTPYCFRPSPIGTASTTTRGGVEPPAGTRLPAPWNARSRTSPLSSRRREVRCTFFGASTGGALALEAAAAGLPIRRLAVYEVPYNVAEDWPATWRTYSTAVTAAHARAPPMAPA